jgi:hypothetical protein
MLSALNEITTFENSLIEKKRLTSDYAAIRAKPAGQEAVLGQKRELGQYWPRLMELELVDVSAAVFIRPAQNKDEKPRVGSAIRRTCAATVSRMA